MPPDSKGIQTPDAYERSCATHENLPPNPSLRRVNAPLRDTHQGRVAPRPYGWQWQIIAVLGMIGLNLWVQPSWTAQALALGVALTLFAFRVARWRTWRRLSSRWGDVWIALIAIPFQGHSRWIAVYVLTAGLICSIFLLKVFRRRIACYHHSVRAQKHQRPAPAMPVG